MRKNGAVKPRVDHPWNLSQDAADQWRSDLAGQRDPRPAHRTWNGALRVAVVSVKDRTAGVVVCDWPSGRCRRRIRAKANRAAVYLPTAPTFLAAHTVEPALSALSDPPDIFIVEEDTIRPGGFGLADHLGVRWGVPSVGVSTACAGEWDEPPPGLDGAHVFVKDGGVPAALAVRARAHRPPLFIAPGHRMDLLGALEVVLSLPLAARAPWPRALALARSVAARNQSRPGFPRRRKVL
jgi:deoxyinosine 3'endonuclease (endonuclease V)